MYSIYSPLIGQKISKKELIGKLIEDALNLEGIKNSNKEVPLEKDPAWKGLEDTFSLGIKDLSERVDEFLYESDGEE